MINGHDQADSTAPSRAPNGIQPLTGRSRTSLKNAMKDGKLRSVSARAHIAIPKKRSPNQESFSAQRADFPGAKTSRRPKIEGRYMLLTSKGNDLAVIVVRCSPPKMIRSTGTRFSESGVYEADHMTVVALGRLNHRGHECAGENRNHPVVGEEIGECCASGRRRLYGVRRSSASCRTAKMASPPKTFISSV